MPVVHFSTSALAEGTKHYGPSGTLLWLSPSDVPKLVMMERDLGTRTLRLKFEYVDQEPGREDSHNKDTVTVGMYSGKLLKLVIDLKDRTTEQVSDRISSLVDAQLQQASRDNQRLHYTLIKQLLYWPEFRQLLLTAALSTA